MPNATTTIREVRNKSSGIDLSIPSYQESSGLVSQTVSYDVLVVTNLACFKSPKHKINENVQFVVPRLHKEFEQLKQQLHGMYPDVILPPVPQKSFFKDGNIMQTKVALENFVKAIASTGHLATCAPTLQFLGLSYVRAHNVQRHQSDAGSISEPSESPKTRDDSHSNLFEEDDDDDDLFAVKEPTPTRKVAVESTEVDEDDLFGKAEIVSKPTASSKGQLGLFETPDLREGIDDDDDLFLPPGAKITQKSPKATPMVTTEDEDSDLLKIEDDLDLLFKPKEKSMGTNATKTDISSSKPTISPTKPKIPSSKPTISNKPNLPEKPAKPTISKKPSRKSDNSDNPVEGSLENNKTGQTSNDPTLEGKPTDGSANELVDTMDNSDIMKYLQDHTEKGDDDLDLFG